MTLAKTSYPPRMLSQLQTRSQQPCVAELGLQLGANLTTHKGHASGGALIGTDANPAPVNPSGDIGHDHSGGEFGRPFFVSIATLDLAGGIGASDDSVNVITGPSTTRVVHAAVAADIPTVVMGGVLRLWCPPCDKAISTGAYAALAAMARIDLEITALRAADVITLQLRQGTPGLPGATASIVLTGSTTATGIQVAIAGSDALLPMLAGAMNTITWSILIARENAGSARGATLRLDSLELGVFTTT